MDYKEIVSLCERAGAKNIDFKFCDLPGAWQHFTVPLDRFDEKVFSEGLGFDGSSIRGFKEINNSDMLLAPDPKTFVVDIFGAEPIGSLICDVYEPGLEERFSNDPRAVAQRAEKFLKASGTADIAYYGPEAEFLFLTGLSSAAIKISPFTASSQWKPIGPKTAKMTVRDIKFATRKVIFQWHRLTRLRMFAGK